MAAGAVSYHSSATKRNTGYGSVKSTRSLGGVSIFQDPEAGTTLPRDEEMTFRMYESEADPGERTTTARSVSQIASVRSSGADGDVMMNGNFNAADNDKGSYTFTFSNSDMQVKEFAELEEPQQKDIATARQSNSGLSSLDRKQVNEKLVKSSKGAFHIKSAFESTQLSRASSLSSNPTLKDEAFKSSLDDTLTRRLKKDKSLGDQMGDTSGEVTGTIKERDVTYQQQSGEASSSQTNGYRLDEGNEAQLTQRKNSTQQDRDSDLTSVSSINSYSFNDSLQRSRLKYPQLVAATHSPDSSASSNTGAMTPVPAVSRSESQRSEPKSLSKAPSLSSINERKELMVTTVYDDSDRGEGDYQFKSLHGDDIGKLDRQSSSVSSETSKTSTVHAAKNNVSKEETLTNSTTKPKFSIQSSMVQNKEFRDKMSSLLSGSSASKQHSAMKTPSLNSSASSTIARGHDKTYRNDVHLDIKTEKQSEKVVVRAAYNDTHSATFPRSSHDDNRPISPEPVSPVHDMQSTIKTGTVGTLIKDKFKNLNLTGRSLDPSTLERQKSQHAADSSESLGTANSDGQKPYKFLIEGIDFPERDAPEAENVKGTPSGEADSDDSSSDSDGSSFSVRKKRVLSKKGFSYVLDKQLASAIIKKAEDVQSRRPHEVLENKKSLEPQEERQESEVLIQAKSKLKHEDSFSGSSTDYRSKPALPGSLLKDIRSRLSPVEPQVEVTETETTVEIKTSSNEAHRQETASTPTKVDTKEFFSASSQGGLDDSLLSSVTTVASSKTPDGAETTVTSSRTLDGAEVSSQDDMLPLSDKKLIYDGFNYEIRHSGLLEGDDAPKSYSQFFKAQVTEASTPYVPTTERYETSQENTRTEPAVAEFEQESPKETVVIMKQTSPRQASGFQSDHEEQSVKVINMQKKQETRAATREEVHTTGVKSLRQASKQGGFNNTAGNSTVTINISQHEKEEDKKLPSPIYFRKQAMEFENDSSPTSPLMSPNFPIFEALPSPGFVKHYTLQSSSSDDSDDSSSGGVQEENFTTTTSPAKRNDRLRTPVSQNRSGSPSVLLVGENNQNSAASAQHTSQVIYDTNKSFGTEVNGAPPLNKRAASGTQVSRIDLPGPSTTKETYSVTLNRQTHTKRRGGGGDSSELYIGVTGGNGKQRAGTGDRLHTSISTREPTRREIRHTPTTNTQDLFYTEGQPQHLVPDSSAVQTNRVKTRHGQLYTTVHSVNQREESFEESPSGQLSPRGGVLYVRRSNTNKYSNTPSEQPSPRYSETTHNSTSSGAVSSPEFTQEIFYQPSPQRRVPAPGHTGRAVSRSSSSSAVGSVNSFRSEGVYVYRTDSQPRGRTLKELNDLKVVHLKPLKVNSKGDGQRVLKTHPTFFSPHNNAVTSPVYLSDVEQFNTSNMMGTSTLRQNMDPGFGQMTRDENMNYKGQGKSKRFLTVDEISGGRVPIHRGMQVSKINIDGNLNDTHSGLSEPVMTRSNKYHVQKVMDTRQADNQFATPIDSHPDMAFKKQKFYSVSRNVEPKSPEVQVELDPHLEEAHKTGDKYNVTMKLNASTIGLPGKSVAKDLFQEEYIEESLYKNNNNVVRSPPPQMISPGMYSSHSTSEDSAIMSPGNRSKTNITLIEDYAAPPPQQHPPPGASPSTLEHMRFTQYMGNPPRVVSTATNQAVMRNDNEPRLRPSTQNRPVQQRVDPGHQGNTTNGVVSNAPAVAGPPKFSMSIDQTMTMDYVPKDDQENNNNSRPVNTAVNRQYVSSETHRRDVMDTSQQRMVNGDDYDLEQYLSPAEEEPIRPSRSKPNNRDGKGYPQVVRGSILIKNAIDTTGAPKVIDVVEGDTESDDDTLIHDNVNPFHGHYFQARENPMYSSDPDLRGKGKPQFTEIFEHTQKSSAPRNHGGRNNRMDYPDDGEFDTEIEVVRMSAGDSGAGSRAKSKSKHSSESTSYVYNGYDHPDRGGRGGGGGAGGSKKQALSQSQKTEFQISRLLKDAPPESIKQTINVEREEEEILGPLPEGDDGTGPDSLLNFDTISEKVDLGMKDGGAQVAVKVRCERIVPIRGVDDMFKKSSVIVTRLIEIDLLVTEERRKLYQYITEENNSRQSLTDGKSRPSQYGQSKLSTKETFKLYKTFMGMAEAGDSGKNLDNIRIDRRIEEKQRPEVQAEADRMAMDLDDGGVEFDTDALERQLEDQLIAHAMRAPEPDTISYLSAASENEGILY